MKFQIRLKDPDRLQDVIDDVVECEVQADAALANLSGEDRADVAAIMRRNVSKACMTWFEYSEYVTLEIDTLAMTCVVVPVKR